MKSPRALLATAAAFAVLSGCDLPTEPPMFEPRWMLAVEESSFPGDQLLPASVVVVGDDFHLSIDPVSGSATLGFLCGSPCEALDGQVAPVPTFEGTFTSTQTLPDDVLSAAVTGGSMEIEIANGFSFDPLEGGGTIVVTIADDDTGAPLGEIMLDGSEDVLLPNTTETRTLPLSAGTVSTALRATTVVEVPGGQIAVIDVSDLIEVTATTTSLQLGSVTVDVEDRSVSFDDRALDLEDVHAEFTDRIVEGAILLSVTNPFGVSLDALVGLGATSKSFAVDGGGTSSATVSYTGDELRSFLGQPNVVFSSSGFANGNAITIQPGQEMLIKATLDFTLQIG